MLLPDIQPVPNATITCFTGGRQVKVIHLMQRGNVGKRVEAPRVPMQAQPDRPVKGQYGSTEKRQAVFHAMLTETSRWRESQDPMPALEAVAEFRVLVRGSGLSWLFPLGSRHR